MFEIRVVNTGSVTLTNVVIEDDLVGFNLTIPTLAPWQDYSDTFNSTMRDGKAGDQYDNVVITRSDQIPNQSAAVTVIIAALPVEVNFTKRVSKTTALPGEQVEYTLSLINNGNSDLQNVTISDPTLGINRFIGTFFQGELLSIPFVIPVNAVPGSTIVNTSRLTASNLPAPGFVESSVSVLVTEVPSLSISKQANLKQAIPGDTITYAITVSNDSIITTLTNIQVDDPALSFNKTILSLPPDSDVVFTQQLELPPGTPAGNIISNTVTAQYIAGIKSATETVQIRANPVLLLAKNADRQFANPGDTVNYTIILTNAGNIVLAGILLTDSSTGISQTITPLSTGESIEISTSAVVPIGATSGTVITNVATAQSAEIGTVTASASISVTLVPPPVVEPAAMLVASVFANRATVFPNENIIFTGNITNVSGITIRNISLTSPLFEYMGSVQQLSPGQTFTIQGTFPVANGTPPGTVIVGSLTATSAQTTPVSETAEVIVLPQPDATIDLTVEPSEALQGETVIYHVSLFNRGNVVLTNALIRDTLLMRGVRINQFLVNSLLMGRLQLTAKSPPGNVVEDTVILTSDQFGPISSSAVFTVYGLTVQLAVNRTIAAVDDMLVYTAIVTNPSPSEAVDVVLNNLIPSLTSFEPGSLYINGNATSFTDISGGVPLGLLAVGASVSVSYTVTVTSEPTNHILTAQVTASFFFPATIRQLSGSSPSNRVTVTIEENEE